MRVRIRPRAKGEGQAMAAMRKAEAVRNLMRCNLEEEEPMRTPNQSKRSRHGEGKQNGQFERARAGLLGTGRGSGWARGKWKVKL